MAIEQAEKIARLEEKMNLMAESIIRMEGKLDAWSQNYPTRTEVNEMFRARDKEIDDLRTDLKDLEIKYESGKQTNKNLLPQWFGIGVSLLALLATIILALSIKGG
jgi:predicted RNase H-like nuclease (RuvC/YqgF family)